MLPNLFILGVQKAGTTSLHNWLQQHPDIFSDESIKDIDFFAHPERKKKPRKNLEKYLADYSGQKILLQTHVNYILYEDALKNIKKECGQPKFLLVLRNPVERAKSAFKYFCKVRRETRTDKQALQYEPVAQLEYSIDNNDFTYIEHGLYFKQLQVFEKHFPLCSLLLIDFDKLVHKPLESLKKIFHFLDIDQSFEPVLKNLNTTGGIKNEKVQDFLYRESGFKKSMIKLLDPIFPFEKRKKIKRWIAERNTSKSKKLDAIDPAIDDFLYNCFVNDIKSLQHHYKLDFASNWLKLADRI